MPKRNPTKPKPYAKYPPHVRRMLRERDDEIAWYQKLCRKAIDGKIKLAAELAAMKRGTALNEQDAIGYTFSVPVEGLRSHVETHAGPAALWAADAVSNEAEERRVVVVGGEQVSPIEAWHVAVLPFATPINKYLPPMEADCTRLTTHNERPWMPPSLVGLVGWLVYEGGVYSPTSHRFEAFIEPQQLGLMREYECDFPTPPATWRAA